jgi:predicted porin
VLFDLTTSTFAAYKYSPYVEQFKPELGLSVGNRQSNMVKYALSQGAFTMEAQISAGEGTGDKTIGGMARYQMGGFAFGAGMLNAKDPAGKQVKGTVFGAGLQRRPAVPELGLRQEQVRRRLQPCADRGLLDGAGQPVHAGQPDPQRDCVRREGS